MCVGLSTHAATSPEKDPSHPQDVCTISTWIQVWPHNEPKENSKGQPTNQIVPVDQTLASPCGAVSSHAGATALLFLPCITAITQQQAILAVTSATNLTEGWIILSIITLSFCVLNRNLNKRGVHILCRTWHFVKSIVTLTVPAAKPKSEWTKMAVTYQNLQLVHSTHLGHHQMLENIYWTCLLSDTNSYRKLHFKNRRNQNSPNKIKSSWRKKKTKTKQNKTKEESELSLPPWNISFKC